MNKQQALQQGLQFTGIYERSIEPVKVRAAQLREQGYRAVVVTERDSEYSRGPRGCGYSVYAEARLSKDNTAKEYRARIAAYPDALARLRAEFEAKVAELDAQKAQRITWLTANGYTV